MEFRFKTDQSSVTWNVDRVKERKGWEECKGEQITWAQKILKAGIQGHKKKNT